MKTTKKILCVMLSLALTLAMPITPVSAAKKKAPKLNKSKLTLTVGKTAKLKVKNTKQKIKWSSSKKSVATVNKKGKVTAKKAGKTTITAKVGKKKLKCRVTVNPKKATTTSTPTKKPSTGTTTKPAETAVKIASVVVKDSLTVEVTLSAAQALKKENFTVKIKKYANGKYISTLDIDNVITKDQKVYEIHIDGNTSYIYSLEHIQVTVSGLKGTGSATAETIYSSVKEHSYEKYISLKVGENLPGYMTYANGYAHVLSKKLPEGIDAVMSSDGTYIEFTGTFATTGKKEGTIVYEDELGNKYTQKIIWLVGNDESILVEVMPSYAMVRKDYKTQVYGYFYISGGSDNYSFSVVDDEYKEFVTVDDDELSLSGEFDAGTHYVRIKATDTENEEITTTFTWVVDVKEGKDITVTIKDSKGNVLDSSVTTTLHFENQDSSNLYSSIEIYNVYGQGIATLLEGTYDLHIECGPYFETKKGVVISADTEKLEYTLPVYKVSLTTDLDISEINWYDETNTCIGYGSTIVLPNGTYTMFATLQGLTKYQLKVQATVKDADTTASVIILSQVDRLKGELTLDTPSELAAERDSFYFTFKPNVTGNYRFYSTSEEGVDVDCRLTDSEYNFIGEGYDEAENYQFDFTVELEAGKTYYLEVYGFPEDNVSGVTNEICVTTAE